MQDKDHVVDKARLNIIGYANVCLWLWVHVIVI